ncbi:MAG: 4-alpha-glucanotransferase, partial [Metallibacterium scheffleri]|uniref:4-alpha-glucanotransferase n=1 Tax=Metallibacterium scheffleri TaxID=993689 RepID=UPI0026EA2AD2
FATDAEASELLARQRGYSISDRRTLLQVIERTLAGILPRYRALAERGQVELAMSPYQHALLPLLIDFAAARETAPGVPLPPDNYPGGVERARWHLAEGAKVFESLLGCRATGCWPSEAALSQATLPLLGQAGLSWTASSQTVLTAAMRLHGVSHPNPHIAYRTVDGLSCFFRDDGLSDRIGFVYKDWQAEHAVDDLVGHLESIAAAPGNRLALIALDGENAWAHYAGNGAGFVRGVYRRLADHPRLRMATLSELVAAESAAARVLPPLQAGSWVHGQLLTWIGDAEKNRAWELLVAAKRVFDAAAAAGRATPDATRLLGVCEGSDWFWWPGSVNPTPAVEDFDGLFRGHLQALYESLGEAPPPELLHAFAHGTSAQVEVGGSMRPSTDLKPWIERSAGVLLHLRSLPSRCLDGEARRFADFAAASGFRVWQFLPVGPYDGHGNPFQPASAFAGDTALVPAVGPEAAGSDAGYRRFCDREHDWLDDWALFTAVRAEQGGRPWFEWPEPLRHCDPAALAAARSRLRNEIEQERRAQFQFHVCWAGFKSMANDRGLLLFGDVPLFVAHDSADVWMHRDLFEVGADGRREASVGVPPDAFSETGQWWGYPPYRWDRIAAQDFRWWRRRFEVQAARFDLVRLDHFRGFAAWWRIPGDARSAADGAWVPGPAHAAIDALQPVLDGARLVAEDLGVITDDVVALRRDLNIPGMRILQFAFDGQRDNPHLPRNHGPDSVCYTGTHDNDTTLGWWRSLPEPQREQVRRALHSADPSMPGDLVEMAWASPAPLAIVPMQDLLGLDSEARMNRPGIAEGNWNWRMNAGVASAELADRVRAALERNGRMMVHPRKPA